MFGKFKLSKIKFLNLDYDRVLHIFILVKSVFSVREGKNGIPINCIYIGIALNFQFLAKFQNQVLTNKILLN